ncbi:MAG: ABC transporter substrate-binding protein [Deltaproteobacteria bacterium]|nr:ABC transporter substrate-binding protein [Deltaproteobacteria bacterium]
MRVKKWMIGIAVLFASLAFTLNTAMAKAKPIKLGALFVMSGKLGGYGKSGWQAIQLAVDEINAQGGILGRKLEAKVEDTKVKPEIGVQIAKKYILKDKMDFLIGPTASSVGLATSDVARQYKKLLVVTQSATDVLTGPQFNRYQFSVLSNALMHARSGAYLMAGKPYKRWMCIGPDYSYGHSSWNMFKAKLKELRPDVEIVGEVFPKLMTADFTPYINKIIEAKPDAVWSPLWGGDAVTLIKQAMPFKLFDQVKFAFPVGASQEVLVPIGKDMPEGIYMSARYFFTTPDSEMNKRFVKAYYERFKEYPSYMAEESYAGVYFLKAAIERAGTTDTEKIIEAVEREPLAWETPEGWKIMRKGDHLVVEDVVWGETVYSEKYGFAILKNMQSIQAEQICRTQEELKEIRANYEKRMK